MRFLLSFCSIVCNLKEDSLSSRVGEIPANTDIFHLRRSKQSRRAKNAHLSKTAVI